MGTVQNPTSRLQMKTLKNMGLFNSQNGRFRKKKKKTTLQIKADFVTAL